MEEHMKNYEDAVAISVNGKSYYRADLSKKIIASITRKNWHQCYCGETLVRMNIDKSSGKKCPVCGRNYIAISEYNQLSAEMINKIELLNSNQLTHFQKLYEIEKARKDEKKRKKALIDREVEEYKIKRQQRMYRKKRDRKINHNNAEHYAHEQHKKEELEKKNRIENDSAIIRCKITSLRYYMPQDILVVPQVLSSRRNVYEIDSEDSLALCAAIYYKQENLFFNHFRAKIIEIQYANYELIEKIVKNFNLQKMDTEEKEVKTDNKQMIFHVCMDISECMQLHHHLTERKYVVENEYDGKDVELTITYCKECDKSFISETVLEDCIENDILPNVTFVGAKKPQIVGLNQESKLRKLGYTVEHGSMSDEKRQRLLRWIVETKIMNKGDILRMLKYLVNYNGKKESNFEAKKKWVEDIEFLERI